MGKGVPQANGEIAVEPLIDVAIVGESVRYMASLPLEANVLFHTVMATKMPFVGRGCGSLSPVRFGLAASEHGLQASLAMPGYTPG